MLLVENWQQNKILIIDKGRTTRKHVLKCFRRSVKLLMKNLEKQIHQVPYERSCT